MIVLDTHAWLWLRDSPERLPRRAQSNLDANRLVVSAISCWEVASLVRTGRIRLDRPIDEWIAHALSTEPAASLAPVSGEIATAAGLLDASFPGDPADRIIMATAYSLGCRLVTRDGRLRSSSPDVTLWD